MDIAPLIDLLDGRRPAVLTGAGCSTESGIPDYRGAGTARRAKSPMQYRSFRDSADARMRYWSRSVVGWPRVSAAEPNDAHRALADLERRGRLVGVITQNVDGLHQRAGSRRVVDLHGDLSAVVCLDCGSTRARSGVQRQLLELNPWLALEPSGALAPDGDADIGGARPITVPDCAACGGVLKPQVVLFGESVPRVTVDAAFALLNEANALLVVGSSLVVFSGYRFVRRAAERGIPIAIVNLDETRADPLARVCMRAKAGAVLAELARRLP